MFLYFFSFLVLLTASIQPLFADDDMTVAKSSFGQPAVMLGIAILFFYFILWRPEQKRRKAMEQRKNSLTKGDKVTAMGIVGVIDEVGEHTVILNIASGKIEILKAAISEVIKDEAKQA